MTRKPLQLLIALACSTPLNAAALGIGQIQVRSALNQALDADIPLLLDNPAEAAGVNVKLAPASVFAQKGIDRPAFLNDLTFAVQTSPDGRGYIKVSSKRPIREPLLNFLVQIDWPKGRIVREFAALLDPPAMLAGRGEPRLSTAPITAPARPSARRPMMAPAPPAPPAPAITHRGAATYGPVPYGATLWAIANQARPDPSISPQRMMQALLAANPRAFWKRNVNGLRAGATLRIPSAQEIDPARFSDELSRQLAARQQIPAAPVAASQRQVRRSDPAVTDDGATTAGRPQIKLVPPDAAGEPQRPEPSSRSTAAPTLAAASLIKLKSSHPELRLAGLDDLRQRLGASLNAGAAPAANPGAAAPPLNPPAPTTGAGLQPQGPSSGASPTDSESPSLIPTPSATGGPPQLQSDLQDSLPSGFGPPPAPAPTSSDATLATAGMPAGQPFELPKPESAPSRSPVAAATTPPVAAALPAPSVRPPVAPPLGAETVGPGGLFLSDWLTPVRLILLGSLLLLLTSGAMLWLRRRSEQATGDDVLAIEGMVPASKPAEHTMPPSRITALETEPVTMTRVRTAPDSLERADLLLAVGNYVDAEKVVRQALAEEPGHVDLLAKLLDVQFAARDSKAFLQTARALHARLGNAADLRWLHIADMGRELYPDEALFSKADELFMPTKTMAHADAGAAPPQPTTTMSRSEAQPAAAEPSLVIELNSGDGATTKPGRAGPDQTDWQLSEIDQPTAKTAAVAQNESAAAIPPTERSQPLDELDWQFPELEPATVPTQAPSQEEEQRTDATVGQEADMDSLFTREITGSQLTGPEEEKTIPFPTTRRTTARASRDELEEPMPALDFDLDDAAELKLDEALMTGIDYVETKLDLAVAYLDLGDPVGARNLLQEVLKEGNDNQQQKAQSLLAKLPL